MEWTRLVRRVRLNLSSPGVFAPALVGLALFIAALGTALGITYRDRASFLAFRNGWYPQYEGGLSEAAANNCSAELTAYWQTNMVDSVRTWPRVQNCLLENTPSSTLINMQAAQVLLGLTPSLIGLIAPSIDELAALIITRPVLGSLLAWAIPTPNFRDLFSALDMEPLRGRHSPPPAVLRAIYRLMYSRRVARLPSSLAIAVSCFEYAIAVGVLANMVLISVDLGLKSNVIWRCEGNYLPILWVVYSVLIFWIAAAGLAAVLYPSVEAVPAPSEYPDQTELLTRHKNSSNPPPSTDAVAAKQGTSWKSLLKNEFVPHMFRAHPPSWILTGDLERTTVVSELYRTGSSAGAVALLAYGSLVMSSLLFVSVNDAAIIVARFLGGTLLCRVVVIFELSSMRHASKLGTEMREGE